MFYKLIIFDPTVDPTYTNLIMTHFDWAHYKIYYREWFILNLKEPSDEKQNDLEKMINWFWDFLAESFHLDQRDP